MLNLYRNVFKTNNGIDEKNKMLDSNNVILLSTEIQMNLDDVGMLHTFSTSNKALCPYIR